MEQSSPDSYSTSTTVANTKNATLDKWLLVLMIFFIIMALIFGILYALIAPQQTVIKHDEPKLYTFSQIYGKEIKNEGQNGIRCNNGKKATIVNAQFYVYDSYRQCYPTGEMAFPPSQPNDFTDDTSDANPNKYCGPYWTGGGANIRIAPTLTGENEYGDTGTGTGCKYDASNLDSGKFRECWGGEYQCTWKTITQYVAAQCDGKSTCNLKVDESIGPSPCNMLMDLGAAGETEFDHFPKSVEVENSVDPANTPGGQSGLYVTGTYLCSV